MTDTSPAEFKLVATSISQFLLKRMNLIHLDREMGAFAGPPGIGKTSMVGLVKREFPGDIVVVTPRQVGIKPVQGMLCTLNAVRNHIEARQIGRPTGRVELESALNKAFKEWALAQWRSNGEGDAPNLTLIFDEAQRFDESFFETIRSWNDPAWSDFVPPIGMAFVGNADFILENGTRGASFLSEAVLSRTAYSKTFEYSDVTDADVRLVLEENGVSDEESIASFLEYCGLQPRNRDLRVLLRIVRAAKREADGGELTAQNVYRALGLDPDRAQGRKARSERKRAA